VYGSHSQRYGYTLMYTLPKCRPKSHLFYGLHCDVNNKNIFMPMLVFTHAIICWRGIICRPFVCPTVCRLCQYRITQTTLHDSSGILVFWHQSSWWDQGPKPVTWWNSDGITLTVAPNAGGIGPLKWRISTNNVL